MAGDKTAARKRALEAKAKLDAERAARDALEIEKTAEFYAAQDRLEAAQAAVETAQSDVEAAVLGLAGVGKTPQEISVLTDLPVAEIRRIKRAAKPTATGGEPGDRKVAGKDASPSEDEQADVQPAAAPAQPGAAAQRAASEHPQGAEPVPA